MPDVHQNSNRNLKAQAVSLTASSGTDVVQTVDVFTGTDDIRTYHVNVCDASDNGRYVWCEILLYESEADITVTLKREQLGYGEHMRWSGSLGASDKLQVRVTNDDSVTQLVHVTYW